MASKIEWTGDTWNPIRARDRETGKVGWFCEHASDGCRFCYAESMNGFRGNGVDYVRQNRDRVEIVVDDKTLAKPLRWRASKFIFPCSMTDIGAEFVADEMLDKIWATMILCPAHTFQVLTKRPGRLRAYLAGGRARYDAVLVAGNKIRRSHPRLRLGDVPIDDPAAAAFHPNIWIGTSVEQKRHLDRLDHLRATPAALRWISFEPLLEDLGSVDLTGISWVVVGGESGRSARPMHPDWARSLRDQCSAAGVPFFFKQWGEWLPFDNRDDDSWYAKHPRSLPLRFWRDGTDLPADAWGGIGDDFQWTARVGKKAAGALLDGIAWRQMPARDA